MRLPNIVCFETIDAGGKQTQAKMLADYIDGQPVSKDGELLRGHTTDAVLRKSFPAYDTPIGKLILAKLKGEWGIVAAREPGRLEEWPAISDALVLQSLMIANKMELADEIERAYVVEGRTVVLDRYIVSGLAYGMADGLELELMERLHARLPKAHHVLIDIPVEESWKRRPKREDAYEADKERLSRARTNYLNIFKKNGVDMDFWGTGVGGVDSYDGHGNTRRMHEYSSEFRVSPGAPYYVVNGIGTPNEVHERIKGVLGI